MKMLGWALALVASVVGGCAANVAEDDGASAAKSAEARIDCSYVKCALPLCGDGQRLSYEGGCCPRCVGAPSRCATVLCAAVACADGEQLVTSPGDCCGRCAKAPAVAECNTADDCPVYNCIQCPCPVSTCVGRKCFTSTPDASTCGGDPTL
jgi:hypothetical protein